MYQCAPLSHTLTDSQSGADASCRRAYCPAAGRHHVGERCSRGLRAGLGCQPVLSPCSSRTNFSSTPSAGVAGAALRFCSPFNYTSLQISRLELGAADENAQEGAQLDYQFYKRKKYGRETNIRLQLFILTRKVKNQNKTTKFKKSADAGSLETPACPGQYMHRKVCRWRHGQDSTCTEKSADGGMSRTVHALRSQQMAAWTGQYMH